MYADRRPPPGPPPPPALPDMTSQEGPKIAAGSDMNSVFADLNKGSAVTSGLRKVDKSQMTHKNPALRDTAPVRAAAGTTIKKADTTAAKRPPKLELEGTKWVVENYENESSLVLNDVKLNHTVYVYGCKNTNIQIKGKFNAITLDNCKKTGLVLDTLVSSVEIVKCQSFALQVMDQCPTIMCDSCDSGQIYLSSTGLACELLTSKCSSINVNIPTDDGAYKEEAVPEMLKHVVVDGKLATTLVEYHD